jgi:hypothetical protein
MSNALKAEDTGDSVTVSTTSSERITIPVTGMTCSACHLFSGLWQAISVCRTQQSI